VKLLKFLLRDNSFGRAFLSLKHDGIVNAVAFSPDGRYAASGSGDRSVRVWEALTGSEIARMSHRGMVHSIAFSPDGKYLASGSLDRTARVWEAATGEEVVRLTYEERVSSVAFSPDGRYVASGSFDSDRPRVGGCHGRGGRRHAPRGSGDLGCLQPGWQIRCLGQLR